MSLDILERIADRLDAIERLVIAIQHEQRRQGVAVASLQCLACPNADTLPAPDEGAASDGA